MRNWMFVTSLMVTIFFHPYLLPSVGSSYFQARIWTPRAIIH
jgi:hypothetical protein